MVDGDRFGCSRSRDEAIEHVGIAVALLPDAEARFAHRKPLPSWRRTYVDLIRKLAGIKRLGNRGTEALQQIREGLVLATHKCGEHVARRSQRRRIRSAQCDRD